MTISIFAYLALYGWIPAVLLMFALLPRLKAASIAIVGAWLILPPYSFPMLGLPDYSKTTAAAVGIALSTCLFCPDRIAMFRPRWIDLPMIFWCFSGMVSSLQNGLGIYDGLASVFSDSVGWGLPYIIGRLHFGDPQGLHYLARAMFIGGLCYVPLCLYEQRMMNSLLIQIYGVGKWGAISGLRWGGYRPNVFFYTGLELGLWMTAASLAGWWLWRCGNFDKIGRFSVGSRLLPVLMITTVLCRSTGALLLMVVGAIALWLSVRFRTRLLLASVLLVPPAYVVVRTTELWSGEQAVDLANSYLSADRAGSLKYRFNCETLLIKKALQQPQWGWGGWGRSDVYWDEDTPWRKRVVTDGLWIIYLGTRGLVGLALFYLAMILPAMRFVVRIPLRLWGNPQFAAASLGAVLLGLYMIDCLMNGFTNIVYVTIAGGLAGLDPQRIQTLPAENDGRAQGQARVAMAAEVSQVSVADHSGYKLGRVAKSEGRFKDADVIWRQALGSLGTLVAACPEQPGLRRQWCDCANDLAWLNVNYLEPADRDPAFAIALARYTVKMYPDSAVYWNTLGTAYLRAGDDALSVEALDRAIALSGGTAFDNVFLAMAHSRLGNHEHAKYFLGRVALKIEEDAVAHPELVRLCDEARLMLADSAVVSHGSDGSPGEELQRSGCAVSLTPGNNWSLPNKS